MNVVSVRKQRPPHQQAHLRQMNPTNHGFLNFSHGIREGIAKGLSQGLVFGIESQKTLYQVHGFVPNLPTKQVIHRWTSGLLSSCSLAGLVFFSYYSIYNRVIVSQFASFAGPISSFVTSSFKIPASNGMRMLLCGKVSNVIDGCKYLYRSNKLRGVYSGYRVSLFEDIIEMDVRNRIYKRFSSKNKNDIGFNTIVGTVAGSFASGITTPFDTLRLHMSLTPSVRNPMEVCNSIIEKNGVFALYRGVRMRVASNAIKHVTFFLILEIMKQYYIRE
jgi:hypothetical protein